ncbi:TPA: hypothetical protein HMU39_21290 [Escherichia coli]|nr:hypothetical protein [Escherichia coli]
MRVLMIMYAYINIEQILARCTRSSLTLTRAVQRPVQENPGRRKLAGARANCGILRRKSAWSWPVSPSGFAGRRDGPVHPGSSPAAAPRFGAMWLCCSLVFSFAPFIRLRG